MTTSDLPMHEIDQKVCLMLATAPRPFRQADPRGFREAMIATLYDRRMAVVVLGLRLQHDGALTPKPATDDPRASAALERIEERRALDLDADQLLALLLDTSRFREALQHTAARDWTDYEALIDEAMQIAGSESPVGPMALMGLRAIPAAPAEVVRADQNVSFAGYRVSWLLENRDGARLISFKRQADGAPASGRCGIEIEVLEPESAQPRTVNLVGRRSDPIRFPRDVVRLVLRFTAPDAELITIEIDLVADPH